MADTRLFERYAAEKTAAATVATLPAYVTEFCRAPAGALTIGNAWSNALFDGPFHVPDASDAERPACSLVFVQSADGNTGADDPSSLGGGDTDKHLIYEGLSRVACDAVLAGAQTIRGGRVVFSVWHPKLVRLRDALGLPRHPVQIVATLKGVDLEDALIFNVPEVRVILLTRDLRSMAPALAARPWISVVPLESSGDLPRAFAVLRTLGIRRVSCVGGRTLARGLLDAGLVDAVYLTTSPRNGGEPQTPLHIRPWRGDVLLRKHGTGPETGVVFEHVAPIRDRESTGAVSIPST